MRLVHDVPYIAGDGVVGGKGVLRVCIMIVCHTQNDVCIVIIKWGYIWLGRGVIRD